MMQPIPIKYSESKSVILTIVVAMLFVFFMIMVLVNNADLLSISDGKFTTIAIVISILASMVLVIAILMMIKSKGTASFTKNTIEIILDKTSFIYKQKETIIPFSNIQNIMKDNDSYGRLVISIKTKNPSKTILIEPQSIDENPQFSAFWDALDKNIQAYNTSATFLPQDRIQQKSMYEQSWAKWMAYIAGSTVVLAILAKIFNTEIVPTWRLIFFIAMVLPFCLMVYLANHKSKK